VLEISKSQTRKEKAGDLEKNGSEERGGRYALPGERLCRKKQTAPRKWGGEEGGKREKRFTFKLSLRGRRPRRRRGTKKGEFRRSF